MYVTSKAVRFTVAPAGLCRNWRLVSGSSHPRLLAGAPAGLRHPRRLRGGTWEFRSRAAVANYAGLVPRHRDSNDKRWSRHITRRGSAHLRGVLIEAAWMAAPRVPVYQALFGRVQGKKNKKTVIVAVARRMLEDAWMLLIKDEAFRYVPALPGDAQEDRTRIPAGPEHREPRSRVHQPAPSVAE